ncbi:MAG: group II intron reverse transcriptase/maturase [Tenericutes bacterium]|jgi:RNA-directed DNA polymerase|nr:group II intron reverse transcriptase/maturase [Mycoplasmatota bacterium]
MKLIDEILDRNNLTKAYNQVVSNKGSAGIDGVTVDELKTYLKDNWQKIKDDIYAKTYKPNAVKRVYIPKGKDTFRPLGIPTAMDRVIQQAVAQKLQVIYEAKFSESSYGFRPGRSCHMAIQKVLEYLNNGYEWIIDLDLEKFFDKVNHDKLIQVLRLEVKDATTLNLIRKYLKAGVMEEGVFGKTDIGTPQGGPISPVLSNILLDQFDKEMEKRGRLFVRYADDVNLFVKSEKAADRVMKSVVSWLERKLFLKVNARKTKVTRPMKNKFLGFGFWKSKDGWTAKPHNDSKQKLKRNISRILCRRKAAAKPLAYTFLKLNQVIRGWINYFKIGSMKLFLKEFGGWMRHKVRVIILKQWKKTSTIYKNLRKISMKMKWSFTHEDFFKVANSKYGPYKRTSMNVCNFILSPKILERPNKKDNRQGLINPYDYYLSKI